MNLLNRMEAIVQPSATAKTISFTNGRFTVVDQAGNPRLAIGAYSTVEGVLRVHYKGDVDEDGIDVIQDFKLSADRDRGAIFDYVVESGTTISPLSAVTIYVL